MHATRPRLYFTLTVALATAVAAVADTGTPYPAGTGVEVTTPAGTVSGVLEDRAAPGWVMVKEPGRKTATAVPEKSVSFIRAAQAAPKAAPASATAVAAPGSDHSIHGQPRVTRPERFAFRPSPGEPMVEGLTVLKRHAFTLGHYDRHKTPAWVVMSWTKEHLDISKAEPSHPRNFQADTDLPAHARTGKDYHHAQFGYERGHMARHEDLSGFPDGADARRGTREGCLMSNIVPQQRKGHIVWGKLEDAHREIVADAGAGIKTVWLISGPVFKDGQAEQVIGPDRVGAPAAVYKIVAWQKAGGAFTARGYIIKQEDTGTDLKAYLTKIDDIEAATGLDFFSDLDEAEEDALEAKKFTTMWGDD